MLHFTSAHHLLASNLLVVLMMAEALPTFRLKMDPQKQSYILLHFVPIQQTSIILVGDRDWSRALYIDYLHTSL